MDLWAVSEKELRDVVEAELLKQIDPAVPLAPHPAREVRVGAYRFDLLGLNADRGLTLVEFKINASKDTLAQLLLYPRALRRALNAAGCERPPPIRVVLVSPFIDRGVVELAAKLERIEAIVVRLAVLNPQGRLALVDPASEPPTSEQCFEQSDDAGRREPEVTWDDGVVVRGIRLGDSRA